MAPPIGEAARAGDAAEKGDVRPRGAADQQHQRDDRADHHAAEQTLHPARRRCAAMATRNSLRSPRQRCLSAETLNRPATATSTTAASTGCGRCGQQVREEQHHHQNDPRGEHAGQRRARAAAFVDERLRHAAADRETASQAGGEIGAASARNSWLASSRPPCLAANMRPIAAVSTAPRRKQAKRQRQQFVPIRSMESPGDRRHGRPCGTSPSSFTPRAPRPSQAARPECRPPRRTTRRVCS